MVDHKKLETLCMGKEVGGRKRNSGSAPRQGKRARLDVDSNGEAGPSGLHNTLSEVLGPPSGNADPGITARSSSGTPQAETSPNEYLHESHPVPDATLAVSDATLSLHGPSWSPSIPNPGMVLHDPKTSTTEAQDTTYGMGIDFTEGSLAGRGRVIAWMDGTKVRGPWCVGEKEEDGKAKESNGGGEAESTNNGANLLEAVSAHGCLSNIYTNDVNRMKSMLNR